MTLQEQGWDIETDENLPPPPEEIVAKYKSTYKDERAIMGAGALEILEQELDLDSTFYDMFKDWIIAGEAYSVKNVDREEVQYERVSPIDIDYEKSYHTKYIEDAAWVVRRLYMTEAEVVDTFYEELDSETIKRVEDYEGTGRAYRIFYPDQQEADLERSKHVVYHVNWKYFQKIGILTYVDELGQVQEMEVPDTYKPEPGEQIEWIWVTEVWEGYRLDLPKDDCVYFKMRPVTAQRNRINVKSSNKLLYNGRRFSDTHSENLSIIELGLPYQILYIVLHFNFEHALARSKGKFVLLDINTIPHRKGWDEEKFFYWAENNGFGFIDRTQPHVDKGWNQYSVIDLSQYEHLQSITEAMNFVRQEWDEVVGITRQRKGQTSASETATGVATANLQSAVISENIFILFEELVNKEREGLLDMSKFAWRNGKRALVHRNELDMDILDIDPEIFMESELGIYVTQSARDNENLQLMRQQIPTLAGQGVNPSTITKMIKATNISKLESVLNTMEERQMKAAQEQAATEQQAQQQMQEVQAQMEQIRQQFEMAKAEYDWDRKDQHEVIKSELAAGNEAVKAGLAPQEQPEDTTMEQAKLDQQRNKDLADSMLKNKEIDQKERDSIRKAETEKLKAKTALKNKVVGEK